MAKVVTFGELMLRLAPNGYYRFFQNDQMQATFGGGEANVAVSLANFGLESVYVTKLPKHAIGEAGSYPLRLQESPKSPQIFKKVSPTHSFSKN